MNTMLKTLAALAFAQVALAGWPFGPRCHKGDHKDDCAALNGLFHKTDGANWCNKENWATDSSVCTWHGVTCDTNGRVSELELGFSGHTCLPPPFGSKGGNGLIGAIPDDISRLSSLTYLSLSDNELGGPIPSSISKLTNLTTLLLNGCGLTSIPDSIGQLKELKTLGLTANELKWDEIPSSMGDLAKLEELTLASNQFPGVMPVFFSRLKALTFLDLDSSQLQGKLPTAMPFPTSLQKLWLYGNQFTGRIPEYIGQLTAMVDLDLSENQFTGPIPESIVQLKTMKDLNLMKNQLSGKFNTKICDLFKTKRNPGKLTVCLMAHNNFTCPLPACASNTPIGEDFKMSCFGYGKLADNTPTCGHPELQ